MKDILDYFFLSFSFLLWKSPTYLTYFTKSNQRKKKSLLWHFSQFLPDLIARVCWALEAFAMQNWNVIFFSPYFLEKDKFGLTTAQSRWKVDFYFFHQREKKTIFILFLQRREYNFATHDLFGVCYSNTFPWRTIFQLITPLQSDYYAV